MAVRRAWVAKEFMDDKRSNLVLDKWETEGNLEFKAGGGAGLMGPVGIDGKDGSKEMDDGMGLAMP